ncbi:MAG: RnfABCDGE type electron transport complex subunit G [Candidatus Ruminococcus intestinipullorum]|nr:RnfABCDGE type electron transport complex subunit G [Candidatus Ruminococcus intestinipullorum]
MKKIIKNTFILMGITIIAGMLLGLVYEITKAPIAKAQEAAKQEAYQQVLSEAETFIEDTTFDSEKATSLVSEAGYSDDITEVVIGKDANGKEIGYVITVTSHDGYGGDISISVGIQLDGTVKGIEMLKISETAGLGMKAAETDFKDQFKDKNVEKFTYTKNGESGDDKIDAISGATITTSAVTNAVDAALVYFQNMLGGSVNE